MIDQISLPPSSAMSQISKKDFKDKIFVEIVSKTNYACKYHNWMAYYNSIEHLPQQELSNATFEIDDTHPDIPQFPSLCVYTNCNKMAVSHFYDILTHCMGYTWPECTGVFRLPSIFNANTNDMTLEDVGITDGFRIEIRILKSANEVEQAPQRVEPDQVPEVQPTTTEASGQLSKIESASIVEEPSQSQFFGVGPTAEGQDSAKLFEARATPEKQESAQSLEIGSAPDGHELAQSLAVGNPLVGQAPPELLESELTPVEQQPALAAKPKKTPNNNSQSVPLRRSKRIRMKERVNYAEYDENDF